MNRRLGLFALFLAGVALAGVEGTHLLERALALRTQAALSGAFRCSVRLDGLSVDWFRRVIVMRGLSVSCPLAGPQNKSQEKGGQGGAIPVAPLLSIARLEARFEPLSLLNRVVEIDWLSVSGGRVRAISGDAGDNFRPFLARWIAGVRPKGISASATIRRISFSDTDLSLLFPDRKMAVTLHAARALLRPNLFMNRFRLEIPSGSLSATFSGRTIVSSSLRATASFAHGGVSDLEVVASSPGGRLRVAGQVLSFDREPEASLFVRGRLALSALSPLFPDPPALGGTLDFRGYLHGAVNRLRARSVVSAPSLTLGGQTLSGIRVNLSLAPGVLRANPFRLFAGTTGIKGSLVARLSTPVPQAEVVLREQGRNALLGPFSATASGHLPLPSRPQDWERFFQDLGRLARIGKVS
ncbi:MAG: hypothetical protein ACP5OP_08200 [Leptospirillia bacterium]